MQRATLTRLDAIRLVNFSHHGRIKVQPYVDPPGKGVRSMRKKLRRLKQLPPAASECAQ
jgi:hypothetical protein